MTRMGKPRSAKVRHLTMHKGHHRYYRSVPSDLRSVVGRSAWTKYFGASASPAKVKAEVRALDLKCDNLIAALRQKEAGQPGWLNQVAKNGGITKLEEEAAWLEEGASALEGLYQDLGVLPMELVESDLPFTPRGGEDDLEVAGDDWAAEQAKADRQVARMKKCSSAIRRDLGGGDISELQGLGTLLPLMRGQQSDKSLQRLTTYLKRFIEYLGSDRDPGAVRRQDAVGWRESLVAEGITGSNQEQHLAKLKAAFQRAHDMGLITSNPFKDIKAQYTPDEKKVSRRKRAFTPDELRKLMASADARANPFGIIVRCLLLTGARSGEICGLRVKDVRQIDETWCFDINDEARPLKNSASVRIVPIPRMLLATILGLCNGRPPSAPLFTRLRPHKQGPAHQLQIDASALIRAFVTEDKTITLHCLRHTWRQRAARLKVGEASTRAIMGHAKGADDHNRTYGARPDAVELATDLEVVAQSLWTDAYPPQESSPDAHLNEPAPRVEVASETAQ